MKLVYIPRQIDRFKGEDAMGDPAYQEAAGQDRIRVEASKERRRIREIRERRKDPGERENFHRQFEASQDTDGLGGKLNSYLIRTRTSFASGGGPEFRSGAHHEALKP